MGGRADLGFACARPVSHEVSVPGKSSRTKRNFRGGGREVSVHVSDLFLVRFRPGAFDGVRAAFGPWGRGRGFTSEHLVFEGRPERNALEGNQVVSRFSGCVSSGRAGSRLIWGPLCVSE